MGDPAPAGDATRQSDTAEPTSSANGEDDSDDLGDQGFNPDRLDDGSENDDSEGDDSEGDGSEDETTEGHADGATCDVLPQQTVRYSG